MNIAINVPIQTQNCLENNDNSISFSGIRSRRSSCGLIWDAIVKGKPCVIKMIMLTSGVHYDKTKQTYCFGDTSKGNDEPDSYVFASGNLVENSDAGFQFDQLKSIGTKCHQIPMKNPLVAHIRANFPEKPIPLLDAQNSFSLQQNAHSKKFNKNSHDIMQHHFGDLAEKQSTMTITPKLSCYFEKNDHDPYRHKEFKHRRAISRYAFLNEVTELTHLGLLNLAPKVYGYYFSYGAPTFPTISQILPTSNQYIPESKSNLTCVSPIHYGFIVMEKVDGSVKDILRKRALDKSEEKIISEIINQIHQCYGSVHGDLQPSNIGIYLNKKGKIHKACFFDCQKIKHKEKYTPEEFNKLIKKDWKMYHKYCQLIEKQRDTSQNLPQYDENQCLF